MIVESDNSLEDFAEAVDDAVSQTEPEKDDKDDEKEG